ncbi:MAG: hypothetical protein QOJ09_2350, partial [Actinomycetota bacterium]|nr:hypothetical protein [Actinomycetota bacterium]
VGTRSATTKPVTVPNPPPGTPTTQPPPAGNGAPPPVVKTTPVKTSRSPISSSSASPSTTELVSPDPGFVRGLPYAGGNAPGDGDNPSVALNHPGGKDSGNGRRVLIPVAFGAILFVGAFQLRWLMRRIEQPLVPPLA